MLLLKLVKARSFKAFDFAKYMASVYSQKQKLVKNKGRVNLMKVEQ